MVMEPEVGFLPVLEVVSGASPDSCFLPRLLSTGWKEGQTPAWALVARAGGAAGQ